MADTVTFRLDPETARILRELTRQTKHTKSQIIKEALLDRWKAECERPTSWEVYSRLYPKLKPPTPDEPLHDRARNIKKLLKEKLLAKRRAGTL